MFVSGRPLIFARHGRTAWNLTGRYQGRSDPPLSAGGRADAGALADRLQGTPVAAIITSPLQRTVATARIVAGRLGIASAPTDDPRLVEIAFGDWEGRTQAEIRADAPDQLRRWKRNPGEMRFPGGETLAQARMRLHEFLSDLAVAAPCLGDGAVLLVTHAGLIRLACLDAAGLDFHHFRNIAVEPGSLRRFILTDRACPGSGAAFFLSETME